MRRALVFIGGSKLQEPAFRYAQDLDLPVLLVDRDAAPACAPLAREHVQVDGTDVEGVCRAVERWCQGYDVAGVYCNNDFGLPAVARLNERLGLPGPEVAAVRNCAGKRRMLEILASCGLPVPGEVDPQTADEFPIVVKPDHGSGSLGVRKIHSRSQLERLRQEDPEAAAGWLAERFLEGTHHDVSAIVFGDRFYRCGVADRFFGAEHYAGGNGLRISDCLPVQGIYPTALSSDRVCAIYELVRNAARALGIHCSPVKADVVWTAAGPVILEIAPRLHGEIVTSVTTPLASGETPIELWLRLMIGKTPATEPAARAGYAVWSAILPRPRSAVPHDAMDDIASIEEVEHLDWRFSGDSGSGEFHSNEDVKGLFVTRAATREAALRNCRTGLAKILERFSAWREPA